MVARTTSSDVKKLMSEPSPQMRGILAGKIASDYRTQQFTPAELNIAQEIFRTLLADAEISIRQSMALELAHCPHAPEDIVMTLARDDHHAVSNPILEHSQVLSEYDLMEIAQSTKSALKLCAIARRGVVSQDLSQTLMETGNGIVMQTLFNNSGSVINESNLLPLWKRLPLTESLMETLVARGDLSMTIVERVYSAATENIKNKISQQYPAYKSQISHAAKQANDYQLLGLNPSQQYRESNDNYELAEELVDDLFLQGKLTHSIVIRALCVGNIGVFECGMARLAGIPRLNARVLMMDSGKKGFKALYEKASMPEGFYSAICTLLDITLNETQFGLHDGKDLRKQIIDRIYMGGYHRTVENMEYLLSVIGGKRTAGENVH